MKQLPPTILICDTNFHSAWARAVRGVIRDGTNLVIGGAREPKAIRDACVTIELTGNAIKQIEARELHPQFPFRHIDQYCNEFTTLYMQHNRDAPEQEKFDYTYIERLKMYNIPSIFDGMTAAVDQLDRMRHRLRESIESDVSSNRDQAITWYPAIDAGVDPINVNKAKPCLQRIWIRHLGDRQVEVHFAWRSRDLYTAWQANIIALVDMLYREVIRPNDCEIVKIVDYSDSMHIYMSDISGAWEVKLVSTMWGMQ